uniref:Uncharacterized protein n=1 Tax=Anguilla anguilla TaxID=7936 RepID=A0A0E9VHV3_ANGAN
MIFGNITAPVDTSF